MGFKKIAALVNVFTLFAFAQTNSGIARHINFGSSLPSTCSPSTGDIFFLTSAGPTGNLYTCTSPNTWGFSVSSLSVGNTLLPLPTLDARTYNGADASVKINACITAAITAGGGTCDARGFSGTQVMSQEIALGSAAMDSLSNSTEVTLLLPDTGLWQWSLTGGTACGIRQYTATAILGTRPGGDTNGGLILDTLNGSANMDAVWCIAASPTTGGAYIRAEGFIVHNTGAGTLANGVIHIRRLFDGAQIQRIYGYNATGNVWVLDDPCCGDNFDHIMGSSAETAQGGIPLVVNGGDSFSISHSTFNFPGVGKNNIHVQYNGTDVFWPTNITFNDVYTEKNGSSYSTPIVYIGASTENIHFQGGQLTAHNCGGGCSQSFIENHSANGIDIENVGVYPTSSASVNDVASGIVWLDDGYSIRHYNSAAVSNRATSFVPYLAMNSTQTNSVKVNGGQAFTNPPIMTWSPSGSCGLQYAACPESSQWTPSYKITLNSWNAFLVTPPNTCVTYGTIELLQGGTPLSTITTSNGQGTYSGTGFPINIDPANGALQIQVGTAAATCTASGSGPWSTIEFKMQ